MKPLKFMFVLSTIIATSFCVTGCNEQPQPVDPNLTKIAITHKPDKTTYNVGEKFNTAGMVVTATYNDGSKQVVDDYLYEPSGELTLTDTKIHITFYGQETYASITVVDTPKPDPGDYYNSCAGLEGSALSEELKDINEPKSKSYDWSRYEAADESPNDSSCIISLYTRHDIKKTSHCGSYSWTTWNREHIYVQASYSLSTTDNHNIFACEGQINNIRNNHKFGEVSHTAGNRCTASGHTTDCYLSGDVFEPCDEAKGEVARAIMYGAVQYNYKMDGMMPYEIALKWHLEHPVTTRDLNRNEVVYKLQKNRNPFVDHPEYACKIWGTKSSTTKKLCGLN